MVKGIARQVLVVKPPDQRFFEQAIFIIREDALGKEGVTDEQILREADRVADGYVRGHLKRRIRVPRPACAALGAVAVASAWAVYAVLL